MSWKGARLKGNRPLRSYCSYLGVKWWELIPRVQQKDSHRSTSADPGRAYVVSPWGLWRHNFNLSLVKIWLFPPYLRIKLILCNGGGYSLIYHSTYYRLHLRCSASKLAPIMSNVSKKNKMSNVSWCSCPGSSSAPSEWLWTGLINSLLMNRIQKDQVSL